MGGFEIFITIVCPLLGCIISNAMIFSPLPAVLLARKNKRLGDLNAIPFALLVNSQTGWTIYAFMKRDSYIFFSTFPGVLFGLYLCFTALHLLERVEATESEVNERRYIENIIMGSATFWLFLAYIGGW